MPDFLLPILFFVVFILILAESIYYLNRHNHNTTEGLETQSTNEQPKSFPLFKVLFSILIIAVIVSLTIFFLKRDTTEKIASTVSPTPTIFIRPTATLISVAQNIISPTINILPTVQPKLEFTPTPSKITTPTKTPSPTKTPIPTKTPSPTRTPTPTKPTASLSERVGDTTEITVTPTITMTPPITLIPTVSTSSSETIIQPKLPVAGIIDQTVILITTGVITLLLGIIF